MTDLGRDLLGATRQNIYVLIRSTAMTDGLKENFTGASLRVVCVGEKERLIDWTHHL